MKCSIYIYISFKVIWFIISFKMVSLLNFCLNDIPIDVSGVLKSLAIIVLLFLPSGLLTFTLYI